ncbi:sulfurtransferase [Usitatibacter palustris]|uniref:Rhodanese domain-containing protein n=1 Tax=Usitatibacter palustris TaxID=2732487 RepID=A0A6M4HD88_9PROT|nr:rhodanese-like domain-containing protein [Usitatibacter palustris]QJR16688.1 hypothetical protein DSM104440_03524 [Usitatibacter palustris]
MKAIASKALYSFLCFLLTSCAALHAAAGPLASVEWLQKNLGREDVLVIDTSAGRVYAAKHVPGAVNVDIMGVGLFHKASNADVEKRFQAWGIEPGRKVVIYDEGASWTATWLYSELHYYGFPAADISVLDGGLAKWEASGGAVTKEPTPRKPGTFRISTTRDDERTNLSEFLVASGDRANYVLVDALETPYYYGGAKFFDRGGHVPGSVSMAVSDFFNEDKTFKSPAEIRKMAAYQGIGADKQVLSHCGGGGAATVPFFALKFLADHPKAKIYKGSQKEWLEDERGLPFWTYAAPGLSRDGSWVSAWGTGRLMRALGMNKVSLVDVRPAAAFQQNHVPFSVSVPAEIFRAHVNDPAKLAEVLASAGVNPSHEVVIISKGGLNEDSALAFVMLEKLGQAKVSLLKDSVDEWGMRGFTLTKQETIVGAPKSPQDFAVAPTTYPVALRSGVMVKDTRAKGEYPKVYVASGKNAPAKSPDGKTVHVPAASLVNADGSPKAAGDIWSILAKAGVPKYAEVVVFSDDPADAAVNYYVMKLMGFPDVKVLAAS